MPHTPGPWTIDMDDERQYGQYRIAQYNAAVGYMRGGVDAYESEDRANALLIMAAPRMFEVLAAIRDRYNLDDRLGGLGDWLEDVLDEAVGMRKEAQS